MLTKHELTCDDRGYVPKAWSNFLIHIHAQYPHMTYHEYRPVMIDALKTYQGEFHPNRIIFPDADSLAYFIITFS